MMMVLLVIATEQQKEMKLVRSLHVYLQKTCCWLHDGKDDYSATNIRYHLSSKGGRKDFDNNGSRRHGTYNAGNNDEKRYDAVQ